MTTAQVLVLILNLYGTTIVVFLVGAAFLGSVGYFVDMVHQDHIAKAMAECDVPAAAPATVPTPAPLQGRAITPAEECMVVTCHKPWEVITHGWAVCPGHDHRNPFDQTLDPELVSAEAEQWLRGIAS